MISSSIDPRGQFLELLSCQNFDLSVGYSQIKSEPTMFVMLSYLSISLEHTPLYLLGLTNAITCSHNYGTPSSWKPGWIVVEPIDNTLISSMILLNIKLVLETSISIIFMSRSWSIWWMKEVTSSGPRAFGASCRHEFEKACFTSFGFIPSQSCTCEEFCGLLDWSSSFHMYILAHQATDWVVQR